MATTPTTSGKTRKNDVCWFARQSPDTSAPQCTSRTNAIEDEEDEEEDNAGSSDVDAANWALDDNEAVDAGETNTIMNIRPVSANKTEHRKLLRAKTSAACEYSHTGVTIDNFGLNCDRSAVEFG